MKQIYLVVINDSWMNSKAFSDEKLAKAEATKYTKFKNVKITIVEYIVNAKKNGSTTYWKADDFMGE